jgi:transposase
VWFEGLRLWSETAMAWRRGQAYGQDLRDRVLACSDMTLVQVATRFGVSPSYVSKVRARLRELGDARPGEQRGHIPLRLAPFVDALLARVRAVPDAKLDEVRGWLQEMHKVSVSYAVMWKVMHRLGLTLKKTPPGGRAGSRGCSRSSPGLGGVAEDARPEPAGVSR